MEQNPIIRAVAELGGVTLVVALKLAWGYWIWSRVRRYMAMPPSGARRLMLAVLPAVAALTFVGAAFNVYSITKVLP
ncbi:MAG: hypothetical protein NTV85_28640 [Hyphomicrobiales bacterium]|nr:hypothetical protein [Hyphomicrobiales bacterium]